jgi:hypothetical protein
MTNNDFFLQFAYESLENTRKAIARYPFDISASLQLLDQAFQCAKILQSQYMLQVQSKNLHIEQFFHQFTYLNWLFLEDFRVEQLNREFVTLEEIFQDLKRSIK